MCLPLFSYWVEVHKLKSDLDSVEYQFIITFLATVFGIWDLGFYCMNLFGNVRLLLRIETFI